MQPNSSRSQRSHPEGERSCRAICRDDVCREVERSPSPARGFGIGANGLQRVSQHGALSVHIVADRDAFCVSTHHRHPPSTHLVPS
jgi:hypothetical protein